MKGCLTLLVIMAVAIARCAGATPISLLDITGSGNTGINVLAGQAVAAGFHLGQSYKNVAIFPVFICIGCEGDVYLMSGEIGPAATLGDIVAGSALDVNSSVSPLLSGLTLGAGDYFLVLSVTTSSVAWVASNPATIASAPGVAIEPDYFTSSINASAPYKSNFLLVNQPSALMFSVTADEGGGSGGGIVPVPEPGTLGLFTFGLAGMIITITTTKRRRTIYHVPREQL